jgi:hypothetical protein
MGLAAADKLHNFDLRTGLENRTGPLRLLDNAAVQFDGDARGVKIQLAEKAENRLTLGSGLRLAVHHDLNGHVG